MFNINDLQVITAFCRLADAMGLQPPHGETYKDLLHRAKHGAEAVRTHLIAFDEMEKRIKKDEPRILVPKVELVRQ